ncbi:MAG: hypothetical protein Q8P59_10355, partial [Dehalococcoidia bacterium]|nr:hypothetical protein [Dehalococcoidia bacterium]
EALLEQGIAPEDARLQSRLSGGRLGWALSARDDTRRLGGRAGDLEALGKALDSGLPERFHLAEELATLYYKDRDALEKTLKTWLGWWRDLLLVKGSYEKGITNVDQEKELHRWGERLSVQEVMTFIWAIASTLEGLGRNVNPRMAIEALMLEAPGYGTGTRISGNILRRSTANA